LGAGNRKKKGSENADRGRAKSFGVARWRACQKVLGRKKNRRKQLKIVGNKGGGKEEINAYRGKEKGAMLHVRDCRTPKKGSLPSEKAIARGLRVGGGRWKSYLFLGYRGGQKGKGVTQEGEVTPTAPEDSSFKETESPSNQNPMQLQRGNLASVQIERGCQGLPGGRALFKNPGRPNEGYALKEGIWHPYLEKFGEGGLGGLSKANWGPIETAD